VIVGLRPLNAPKNTSFLPLKIVGTASAERQLMVKADVQILVSENISVNGRFARVDSIGGCNT
jgi:hypothetical protein